jgi:hypothetical protein
MCAGVRSLGVKQTQEINSALLGKWCWRMVVNKTCLWYRVWRVVGEGAAGWA